MKTVAEVIGVSRSNLIERMRISLDQSLQSCIATPICLRC